MEYADELSWRLRIQSSSRMPRAGCEFLKHAGTYVLVDWGANPLDASTVKVYNERVVQQRFGSIAERMAWSIETYYRELCNPTPGFHTQNVKYAMELTSGTLRMFGSSLENCTAPDEAIEEMFVGVRDFMGEIAKSQILISEHRAWEIKGHAGALIAETLRRVGCNRQRIVA